MLRKIFKSIYKNDEKIEKSTLLSENIVLNSELIPEHVAIIMDGNGRWAKKRGKNRTYGHKNGAETLKKFIAYASKLKIKVVTAYAFSTENWKRPKREINFIMSLLDSYLTNEIDEMMKDNIKVIFSGDKTVLPEAIIKKMDDTVEKSKNNTGIILNLAINYGGQAEIIRATKNISSDVKNGLVGIDDINNELFEKYLYTKDLPMVDLLIRPGGDFRISNFLLWQIAYAEIWVSDVFWPDFTEEMLKKAIFDFQKRDRRYGGINTNEKQDVKNEN